MGYVGGGSEWRLGCVGWSVFIRYHYAVVRWVTTEL